MRQARAIPGLLCTRSRNDPGAIGRRCPNPSVLLGLWVWSTEFDWARRVFATFARKGRDAWKHARQHPVSSAAVTVGGLAAAVLVFWAVGHFDLVERGKSALGL